MTSRYFRFAVLFVLLLQTAQVAQPYIFRLMYSETTPKLVVPRGNLSEAEQATIALFDQVSPSVVQGHGACREHRPRASAHAGDSAASCQERSRVYRPCQG